MFVCPNVCFCLFLFFRLDWPELLDHPFWTQVLKEEEGVEEGEEEEAEKNGCEMVGSASSRCVDILLFLDFTGPTAFYGHFVAAILLHTDLLCKRVVMHPLMVNGRCCPV